VNESKDKQFGSQGQIRRDDKRERRMNETWASRAFTSSPEPQQDGSSSTAAPLWLEG